MHNSTADICYITTNGIGNVWVAAELEVLESHGVKFELSTMRSPDGILFKSKWARDLNQNTRVIYPLPAFTFITSNLLAPFRFRSNYFSNLANALFSSRENSRARIAGIAHFFVACFWATKIQNRGYKLIHSQWIHSCGTIGFYAANLLGLPFSFTGHAVDLFRDRCALTDKVRGARFIVAISNFHKRLYIEEGADPDNITVAYCGINVEELEFRERSLPSDSPVVLGKLTALDVRQTRHAVILVRTVSKRP